MKQKQKNKSGNDLVTKDFFKSELDYRLGELEQQVDDKAQKYRDQILTSNDKLAKTLETIREDLEIGSFQLGEKIEDHEKRIKSLEKIQPTA